MRMILKSAAIAVLLAGTAAIVATPASAYDSRHSSGVSISIGGIAFGYRDGYWDNNHAWHRWHDRREYSSYRSAHRADYRDWNHDRDRNMGWRR